MKPFEYLKSEEVLEAWERELKKLDKETEVQNANVMSRIYDIFRGIERLEKAMASLRADFRIDRDNIDQQMLKEIQDAVDGRCLLIVKNSKLELIINRSWKAVLITLPVYRLVRCLQYIG
jgi:hypothetical protein